MYQSWKHYHKQYPNRAADGKRGAEIHMEIVNVKNLKKLYGDFLAVDNISFLINKGEIFGFLGPNGAGKTSTINMLTGSSAFRRRNPYKQYRRCEDIKGSAHHRHMY